MSKLSTLGVGSAAVLKTLIGPQVGHAELCDALGYVTNAGTPGSVVPDFIGQVLFDTSGLDFYRAFGTAAGNWAPAGIDTETLTELAFLDGAVAGTATASKAVVLDSSGNLDTIGLGAVTGADSSLGITGQAAAQGGAVAITGGVSSTTGNTGGAASLIGGAGGATGIGGAANVTGAVGGTAAAGGAVNLTGGAGTTSGAGGAVVGISGAGGTTGVGGNYTVTAGRGGSSSGAAGVFTATAGAGGAGTTTAGGVASLIGGASGTGATGKGGAANVTGGAALSTNADGGGTVIAGGAKAGSGFIGPVVLGNAQLMPIWYPQAAPASDGGDTPFTATVAQLVAGIISMTPTTGRAITTPTGAEMDAGVAFADVPATFGFDFSVQNRAAFAATDDIITLTAGASGMTVNAPATVAPGVTARFRAVRTATATWIINKIAG